MIKFLAKEGILRVVYLLHLVVLAQNVSAEDAIALMRNTRISEYAANERPLRQVLQDMSELVRTAHSDEDRFKIFIKPSELTSLENLVVTFSAENASVFSVIQLLCEPSPETVGYHGMPAVKCPTGEALAWRQEGHGVMLFSISIPVHDEFSRPILGQTRGVLLERFGEPSNIQQNGDSTYLGFMNGSYKLFFEMIEGKSESVIIGAMDGDLSPSELRKILDTNRGLGGEWSQTEIDLGGQAFSAWEQAGGATAVLREPGRLDIRTLKAIEKTLQRSRESGVEKSQ